MKNLLTLAATLLALASCSKKDPDPTPTPTPTPTATLTTRWQVDSTWVTASTGAPRTNIRAYTGAGVGWEFTATDWIVYAGNAVDKRNAYTRTGNTITSGTGITSTYTILALTPHRLVLQSIPDGYAATTTVRATFTASR